MSFKFSTNFLLSYVRKPAKYDGRGSTGLDATPTVQIHICHPVIKHTGSSIWDHPYRTQSFFRRGGSKIGQIC
jgi:hypothetical protein